jgi:hypothetical protein
MEYDSPWMHWATSEIGRRKVSPQSINFYLPGVHRWSPQHHLLIINDLDESGDKKALQREYIELYFENMFNPDISPRQKITSPDGSLIYEPISDMYFSFDISIKKFNSYSSHEVNEGIFSISNFTWKDADIIFNRKNEYALKIHNNEKDAKYEYDELMNLGNSGMKVPKPLGTLSCENIAVLMMEKVDGITLEEACGPLLSYIVNGNRSQQLFAERILSALLNQATATYAQFVNIKDRQKRITRDYDYATKVYSIFEKKDGTEPEGNNHMRAIEASAFNILKEIGIEKLVRLIPDYGMVAHRDLNRKNIIISNEIFREISSDNKTLQNPMAYVMSFAGDRISEDIIISRFSEMDNYFSIDFDGSGKDVLSSPYDALTFLTIGLPNADERIISLKEKFDFATQFRYINLEGNRNLPGIAHFFRVYRGLSHAEAMKSRMDNSTSNQAIAPYLSDVARAMHSLRICYDSALNIQDQQATVHAV